MGYTLFGTNISSSDIIGGNLYGTFMIQDNSSAVVIGIAEDAEIEGPEDMKFSINGTGAFADVVILGQEESHLSQQLLKQLHSLKNLLLVNQ